MSRAHEWHYWLLRGPGRVWSLGLAVLLGAAMLSLCLAWQRERGPEAWVIEQALAGRQLATGHGWSTPVNYPQSVATLQAHAQLDLSQPLPELHHAPGYGALMAVTFWLSGTELQPADGAAPTAAQPGDRCLLVLNLAGLWLSLGLTFALGCRVANVPTAAVATAAVLLSPTLWEHLVAVDGTIWLVAGMAGLLWLAADWERVQPTWRRTVTCLLMGGGLGLLTLFDYALLAVVPVVLIYLAWQSPAPQRWVWPLVALVGFVCLVGPWALRNITLTGHPLGLAGQSVALRADDPTADPLAIRASFDAVGVDLSFRKLFHKALSGWREALQVDMWRAGGLFAFLALLSLLYRFQRPGLNTWRWLVIGLLAALVTFPPAFVSGLSPRAPLLALLPGLAVIGVAFLEVIRKNTRPDRPFWRIGVTTALLILHGVPLLHLALEPRRLPFQYPPYWPPTFRQLAAVDARLGLPNGAVSDEAAAWSWYAGGDFRVWQMPADLADWPRMNELSSLHLLYLSPRLLEDQLADAFHQKDEATWDALYRGMVMGKLPKTFPLQRSEPTPEGGWVFLPGR